MIEDKTYTLRKRHGLVVTPAQGLRLLFPLLDAVMLFLYPIKKKAPKLTWSEK